MTRLTSILAVIFLAAAFTLAWMNRTPDAGNVIGRARAERMRSMERTDWWVAAPAPELLTEEAPSAPDASPAAAADEPAAAPAAAAPTDAEGESAAEEADAGEGGGS